jgi:hypothetical protein
MTTYAYTAKAALFDRLEALAATGQPLDGIQVGYAYPGTPGGECIYGGGVRFEQRDAVAEAPGIMVAEETLVTVYIRVMQSPPVDVRDTDVRAAAIGTTIGSLLRTEPTLAGGNILLGIARGQGDYTQTDDETISILAYQVRVVTNLTYGSL